MDSTGFWRLIHGERTRVAGMLEGFSPEQWATQSLCTDWSVEQVVAHLTAAANTGTLAWTTSIVRSGFNPQKHNARQLQKYMGENFAGTLETYRRSIPLTIAPTKDHAAYLGEVVVHGQDITRPLGLELIPGARGLLEVARFFAARDFTVNSKSQVKGLRLEATDADFEVGNGPEVRGALLDLVMAMAGRDDPLVALSGAGVEDLRNRP